MHQIDLVVWAAARHYGESGIHRSGEARIGEISGVLAAVLSGGLGGTAVAVTRFVIGATDPLTLGVLRFGIGFVFLLPIAVVRPVRWPRGRDWVGAIALGLLFFALFPILFNASLAFTTAARGALAFSSMPLLTMVAAAVLRIEPLTARKTVGVLIASIGVAFALISGLSNAPDGAWRGDLLMVSAALCMSFYNIWSKPFIRRSAPVQFTIVGMAAGTACLALASFSLGGFAVLAQFGRPQWAAAVYLGTFGAAAAFLLWAFALGRTTPTRAAISIMVNPITAAIVGAVLLGEPIRWNLIVGLAAVFAGIWIATTAGGRIRASVANRAD